MLTQEYLKSEFHYDPETGLFTRLIARNKYKIGEVAGTIDNKGYVRINIAGKYYRAHRLAFLYMTGEWPKNQGDHKNRIRNDNRWENLRDADRAQQQYNRIMKNKTGYKGVQLINGWYIARIKVNKTRIHLGTFNTVEEAANAYSKAADWIAGEFKNLA